jgi:hypothetical protein
MSKNSTYLDAGKRVPRQVKVYDFEGYGGCVTRRRSQQSKTIVAVYRNDQAGLDTDEPWSTVCETHGTVIAHDTLKLALYHLADPEGWCEECMKGKDGTSPV